MVIWDVAILMVVLRDILVCDLKDRGCMVTLKTKYVKLLVDPKVKRKPFGLRKYKFKQR